MTVKASHREFVRAVAVGEPDKADKVCTLIPTEERDDFHLFVTAFFNLMLEQRFHDGIGLDDVRGFVNEMRSHYRKLDKPIKPLTVEGVIRASLGEEHFFEEISGDDALRSKLLVIGKIALQSPNVLPRIDNVLNDAATLTEVWVHEEG